MASSLETIRALVHKIKETTLVSVITNPCSFVSPSAYETAWLAMLRDPIEKLEKSMFTGCLNWISNNQKPEGFWGESDCHGDPTLDSLPATLACMVALKTWDVGHEHIQRGMEFITTHSTKLLEGYDRHIPYPRWFAIVFPGMVQLARRNGLQVMFEDDIQEEVARVFRQRHLILTTEKVMDKYYYPPLMSFLEVLPKGYHIDNETILANLDDDGSLFRSPSATVAAFMATGNQLILSYLRRLLPTCTDGVPSMYPIDEDSIKLDMVNQLRKLGLFEFFPHEIKEILEQIHRQFTEQQPPLGGLAPKDIFKDSLAFQLLRMNGYKVSPRKLCWFLDDGNALAHIEKNPEKFSSMLYALYQATNLTFQGEFDLQHLRSFSRKLLIKSCQKSNIVDDDIIMWPHLQEGIKQEISTPWIARMDHLDHRKWIEANMERPLWLGKASYYRISCLDDPDLLQLAQENYEYRQHIYRKELQELIRWSNTWGLMDMGFAREKTAYCYFAISSTLSLPFDSEVRLIAAKSAVLVTIIDDFYDMHASLDELIILTKAVQRWDNKGLSSHSRILFDVLDDFVNDVAKKYHDQHKVNIVDKLQHIWYETFESWLKEATWSKTGEIPSMTSYLETCMISISAHTVLIPASYFLESCSTPHDLNPSQYEAITNYLMISCRLLNDIQSYEKEQKDGKFNSVLLYLKENPNANIEDAIRYVQNLVDEAKIKLLEHALTDEFDDLPMSWKMFHLSCLKVFQMFFNSGNHFDSKDSLLNDINKAIFEPLGSHHTWCQPPKTLPRHGQPKTTILASNFHFGISFKYHRRPSSFTISRIPRVTLVGTCQVRAKIPPNYLKFSVL